VIIADTSVWADHLGLPDSPLIQLLEGGYIIMHPYVLGELALGTLPQRRLMLAEWRSLPEAVVAEPEEILAFIDRHDLAGTGIGYVDVHLLASTRLTDCLLWTRDKRLALVAQRLGLASESVH
jgi:predicted nucleic acid-binding protein